MLFSTTIPPPGGAEIPPDWRGLSLYAHGRGDDRIADGLPSLGIISRPVVQPSLASILMLPDVEAVDGTNVPAHNLAGTGAQLGWRTSSNAIGIRQKALGDRSEPGPRRSILSGVGRFELCLLDRQLQVCGWLDGYYCSILAVLSIARPIRVGAVIRRSSFVIDGVADHPNEEQ